MAASQIYIDLFLSLFFVINYITVIAIFSTVLEPNTIDTNMIYGLILWLKSKMAARTGTNMPIDIYRI